MQPEIVINYLAVLVCVVVSMPVGFLWFGPLFGKRWAAHMGLQSVPQPDRGTMAKSMIIYALGGLLIAFVLAHSIEVWRPSVWKVGADQPSWVYAINATFWTWIGFFLPLQMGRVAWEFKKWELVAINASFDFTRLLLFGFILAYWR
jgi:hypothetical protein